MDIIVAWVISVLASFGMDSLNRLRLFKDVMDSGYILNLEKYHELEEIADFDYMDGRIRPNQKKVTKLDLFLPFFLNMIKVIQRTANYNNQRENILYNLDVMGCLEKMSNDLKKLYDENRTGLNAFLITKFVSNNQKSIRLKDGSIIEYCVLDKNKESLKNIVIINSQGPVCFSNDEKQKEYILNTLEGKDIEIFKEEKKEEVKECIEEPKIIIHDKENENIEQINMEGPKLRKKR